MRIQRLDALRGPNIYSPEPVLIAIIDWNAEEPEPPVERDAPFPPEIKLRSNRFDAPVKLIERLTTPEIRRGALIGRSYMALSRNCGLMGFTATVIAEGAPGRVELVVNYVTESVGRRMLDDTVAWST